MPFVPVSVRRWALALSALCTPLYAYAQEGAYPARADAPPPATYVLVGVGPMDHGNSLVQIAASVNVRRALYEPASETMTGGAFVALFGPLPSVHVDVEGIAQVAGAGTLLTPCSDGSAGCARDATPDWFAGAGLASRIHLTRPSGPVVFYALPLTAMLYARGADDPTAPEAQSDVRLGAGLGAGLGLRVRAGRVAVLLEARAISTHDFTGGHGGSLPVSIGVAF